MDSKRAVTLGQINASPLAAARIAWPSKSGPASLRTKPRAPARRGVVYVLVEVVRGDYDYREWGFFLGPGKNAGCLDSVHSGHSNVEQTNVRPQPPGKFDRLVPVAALANDFDVRLVVQYHAESGADQRLIVGDQHPYCHGLSAGLGDKRINDPTPVRTAVSLELSAQQGDPLGHADDSVSGSDLRPAAGPVRRRRPPSCARRHRRHRCAPRSTSRAWHTDGRS